MGALFLYNPMSGKGKVGRKLNLIEKSLKQCFGEVELYQTQSAEDLEEKIRTQAERYDAVIFSGGDGTFNHVLTALEGRDVQLGYIPSGTINDVARSLKIPRSIKGALKVITKGHSKRLDCMKVGNRYAMYIVAAGAFTEATYYTPQKDKRRFGALAYAFEGVRHHLKLDVFPIEVTSGETVIKTPAVLVLVMNGKSVAGFPINKQGSMKDGVLELALIKQVMRPNLLQRIGKLFSVASLFVFGCRIRKHDVIYLKGERFAIKTERHVVWDFDGERGFNGNTEICVCKGAVRLFVPKNKKI